MKPYEKIPKDVKHHIAIAILVKTLLDNVESKTKTSTFYSNKYGSGIIGFKIRVGDESLKKVTDLAKRAWTEATGGKLKINNTVNEFVYMLVSTIPQKDHFDLFLVKPYKPGVINDDNMRKYHKYVLVISEFLVKELGVCRPYSVFKPKKEKKSRKKTSPLTKVIKKAKKLRDNMRDQIELTIDWGDLYIIDKKGKYDVSINRENKTCTFNGEIFEYEGDVMDIHDIFILLASATDSSRYSNPLLQSVGVEKFNKLDVSFDYFSKIHLKGSNENNS